MNVEVIDPGNLLSKSQKLKAKTLFKNNAEISPSEILERLSYSDENVVRYNALEIEKSPDQLDYYFLRFSHVSNEKENLKHKLKNKMSYLKNRNRKDWQYYESLRRKFGDSIPTPDEVRNDKTTYDEIQKNIKKTQNPIYQYIQICMDSDFHNK